MKSHLESKIVLFEDAEHSSLYRWSLREIGEETSGYQRDKIPWLWSQYFTMSEIKALSSLNLSDWVALNEEKVPKEIKEKQVIRAKLFPSEMGAGRIKTCTHYSMFGTNRTINSFEIEIFEVEQGKSESSYAWASVSHTTEIDFRDVKSDDVIVFGISVSKERFSSLLRLFQAQSISGGSLRVRGVDGFYAEWSPGISTSHIKVLTGDEKDHPVEIPEGCLIVPPRVGRVGDFELYLDSKINFQAAQDCGNLEEKNHEEISEPSVSSINLSAAPFLTDTKALAVLKSLRTAAWIVIGLLFLIMIK